MKPYIKKFKNLTNWVLDVLFPAMCIGCGKEGQYVCERCDVFLNECALICPTCQQTSFTGEAHEKTCRNKYGMGALASVWEYEGLIARLLWDIKYQGITHMTPEIVERAFSIIVKDEARFSPFLDFVQTADALAYVPVFQKKERRRGFNQAKLIAQAVSKILYIRSLDLLGKRRDTVSQTELDRLERMENVKGSFEYKGNSVPSRVVLVDDVWTTGATLRECCKVLKKAGVREVWGFTLARTP